MAIGTPVLLGGAGAGGTTTATTVSATPEANSILLAFGSGWRNTQLPVDPAITDSVGLTWRLVGPVISHNPGAGRRAKSGLWWAAAGASPVAMTVTATVSDGVETTICVVTVTGISTSDFTNFNSATSTTGDPSFALSDPSTASAIFGFSAMEGGNAVTQPTGYTELLDATIVANSANRRHSIVYDLSSPGTTLTWSSSNLNTIAIGVELKEPIPRNFGMVIG